MSFADVQALEDRYLMRTYRRSPVEFVRGEGALLWDSEGREYLDFMTGIFGQAESGRINLVELPEDSVSAFWAPQMAALNGTRIGVANSSRLLANTIARQWWSSDIRACGYAPAIKYCDTRG